MNIFVGQVRDHDPDAAGEVVALDYSAHPDAAKILVDLVASSLVLGSSRLAIRPEAVTEIDETTQVAFDSAFAYPRGGKKRTLSPTVNRSPGEPDRLRSVLLEVQTELAATLKSIDVPTQLFGCAWVRRLNASKQGV